MVGKLHYILLQICNLIHLKIEYFFEYFYSLHKLQFFVFSYQKFLSKFIRIQFIMTFLNFIWAFDFSNNSQRVHDTDWT